MDEYRRRYCWTCDRMTMHEDGVCMEHSSEDEYEDPASEEDRRVNEDATYRRRTA